MTSPGLILLPSMILRSIYDANDATSDIVFALAIHAGHLRSLASQQRATSGSTCARKAKKQLLEHATLQSFAADVIEEEQRARAKRSDVVYAMIYEIRANGVVLVDRKRDLQFRPDTVDTRDQHWLAHPGKAGPKQSTEPADSTEHLRTVRLPNDRPNLAF